MIIGPFFVPLFAVEMFIRRNSKPRPELAAQLLATGVLQGPRGCR